MVGTLAQWQSINWREILVPDTSPVEIVLRGSITYIAIFLALRLVLKRQSSTLGMTDLLVLVLIADAAQNAMAGDYKSVPDGILLVVTIILWAYAFDWLGYRFPRLRPLFRPPPLRLIQDGKLLRRNMRKELVTEEELLSQLREHGVDNPAQVREAYMEGDGSLSVVLKKRDNDAQTGPPKDIAGRT